MMNNFIGNINLSPDAIMDEELSKKEEVYQSIKNDIMTGVVKPGEVIKEGLLAKKYNTSKTPVREALCILAYENMLQVLPRAGYLVKPITIKDVIEVFDLRELLEVKAAALAAKYITPREIHALEKYLDYSDVVLETGASWNREFHCIIARACGNSRLERMIRLLYDEVNRIILLDPELVSGDDIQAHVCIVDALKRQDSADSAACMLSHIVGARERVLGRL